MSVVNRSGRLCGASRSQSGYLLPAVLIITAAIMIFITLAYDRAQQQMRDVGRLLAMREAKTEQASAEATILYLLASETASAFGYGLTPGAALRVDGQPYKYGEHTLIRLQDAAGLIDANRADITVWRRLAEYVGVPVEKRDTLADRILDYIDTDDLRRINGAEAAEYAAAGAPPPRNRALDAPEQLRGVLGWDKLMTPEQAARFESALGVDTPGPINPNAASPAVLVGALGVPPQLAEALVARRAQGAILTDADLAGAMPATAAPLALITDPVASQRVRVTVFDRTTGIGNTTQIVVSPFGQYWPWSVDSTVRHAEKDPGAADRQAIPLPELPTRKTATNEPEPGRMY